MKTRVLSFVLTVALLIGFMSFGAMPVEAVSDYNISQECLDMIKEFEGFSAKPYWDYGQWTVGYGTRVNNSTDLERYQKEGISKEEATKLLLESLQSKEDKLNEFIDQHGLKMDQGKFDALLSITFNCGTAWLSGSSTFRTYVIEGRTGNDFLFAMGQWSTAGGEVQRGLVTRRLIEINMYLNGVYSMDVPENYDYVLFDANGGERDVKVQCYDSNLTAKIVSTPTYEGHTFVGWYTAAQGGEKVEILNSDVAGFKLYAHWVEGNDADQGPSTEVPGTGKEPVTVTVKATDVNIRKGPGTGYAVVTMAQRGDKLTITETATGSGYTWGKCSKGWIVLSFTDYDQVISQPETPEVPETPTEPEPPTEPDTPTEPETPEVPKVKKGVVDSEDGLRIRSKAGVQFSIVGFLNHGDPVEILEETTAGGRSWGRIEKGWICLDYVRFEGEEEKEETKLQTGTVIGSDLRIRSGAGTGYSVLGLLNKGDQVQISQIKTVGVMVWGKIQQGWVCMEYVKLNDAPQVPENGTAESGAGTVTGDSLRVRKGPGTNYGIVGYLNTGDRVVITETKSVSNMLWGKTASGWICMDYVRMDSQKPQESVMGTVKSDSLLRIRNGAGAEFTIVGYLDPGTRVEILERKTVGQTVWGRTEKGWINLSYVTLDGEKEQPQTKTVIADALNIRQEPGVGNKIVGVYYEGDQVTILETKAVGSVLWGRTDKGWISMDYVK